MSRIQRQFIVSLTALILCSIGLYFLMDLSLWASTSDVVPQYLASTAAVAPFFGFLVVAALGWWCLVSFVKWNSSKVEHAQNNDGQEQR